MAIKTTCRLHVSARLLVIFPSLLVLTRIDTEQAKLTVAIARKLFNTHKRRPEFTIKVNQVCKMVIAKDGHWSEVRAYSGNPDVSARFCLGLSCLLRRCQSCGMIHNDAQAARISTQGQSLDMAIRYVGKLSCRPVCYALYRLLHPSDTGRASLGNRIVPDLPVARFMELVGVKLLMR
jgi:hypothetical protein